MELNIISDCTEAQVNKVVKVTEVTVAAVKNGKYIFVKQRGKGTMELPGTAINSGENASRSAKRLLEELVGAKDYGMQFVCPYSVSVEKDINYGILYRAEIVNMGEFPRSELAGVYYLNDPPEDDDKWSCSEKDKPLFDAAFRK